MTAPEDIVVAESFHEGLIAERLSLVNGTKGPPITPGSLDCMQPPTRSNPAVKTLLGTANLVFWQVFISASGGSSLRRACRLFSCPGHCRWSHWPRSCSSAGWRRHSASGRSAAWILRWFSADNCERPSRNRQRSRNHSVEGERACLGRSGWPPRQPLLQAWDRVRRLVTRRALESTGEGAGRQRAGRARSKCSTAWIRLSASGAQATQPGELWLRHPEGMREISRGLSAAIPPETG
jgi:hypothetical protein